MKVRFAKKFKKDYRRSPLKIRRLFDRRLKIFVADKFYPALNNHSLECQYKGCRSINITGDWRAIFREFDSGRIVYFDLIGTHSQLYKK